MIKLVDCDWAKSNELIDRTGCILKAACVFAGVMTIWHCTTVLITVSPPPFSSSSCPMRCLNLSRWDITMSSRLEELGGLLESGVAGPCTDQGTEGRSGHRGTATQDGIRGQIRAQRHSNPGPHLLALLSRIGASPCHDSHCLLSMHVRQYKTAE